MSELPPYGPMTPERCAKLKAKGVELRVFRFNVDVTDRCRYFDDTPGKEVAVLFLRNDAGHFYLDRETGTIAREIVGAGGFQVRRVALSDLAS